MKIIANWLAHILSGLLVPALALAAESEPVKIGLVAALSGASALSGEAITRGLNVAIDEINARGGVIGGRKLVLVRRDDESNPAKGQVAARELIEREKVAIVFGGIDTPVSIALVPVIHELKVPYMGVWAAGTGITQNNQNPNYMFRVSVVDDLADKAMVNFAMKTYGAKKPAAMLINNPWGESNEKGLTKYIAQAGITNAGIEKFNNNDVDMAPQLSRLKANSADAIFLVTNAPPGAQVMKSLQRVGWKVPVVSHWGITGGRFDELAGSAAKDVVFLQTYSFFGKQSPTGERVMKALMAKYPEIKGPADIVSPVGTANAYDAMHLTALALDKAGSAQPDKLREAFYTIGPWQGLIKNYVKPFSSGNHDALTENDYIWAQYDGKNIVPARQ
jgi:branched-chain amino acid transport system substrate-binding protein